MIKSLQGLNAKPKEAMAPPKVRKGMRKTAAAARPGSDEPGGSSPSENGEGGFQVSFGFAWSPSILIPQLFP